MKLSAFSRSIRSNFSIVLSKGNIQLFGLSYLIGVILENAATSRSSYRQGASKRWMSGSRYRELHQANTSRLLHATFLEMLEYAVERREIAQLTASIIRFRCLSGHI
jgi:hypothetical protein